MTSRWRLTFCFGALAALSATPAPAQVEGDAHGRVASVGDSTAAITLEEGIAVEVGTVGWSSTTVRLAEADVDVVSARCEVVASTSGRATVRIALRSNTNPIDVGHAVRFGEVQLIPQEGGLAIETLPWGAAIAINGEQVGVAPWRGSLEPGTHEINLSARGYEEETRRVAVVAGATEQVRFDMTPVNGRLTVTTEPAGAEVWVDGEFVGQAPFSGYVSSGRRHVRLAARGYHPEEMKVDVSPQGDSRHLELEPVTGIVIVESDGRGPYRLVQEEGDVPSPMRGTQHELGVALEVPVGTYAVVWAGQDGGARVRVDVREDERARVFLPRSTPIEEPPTSKPHPAAPGATREPRVSCRTSLKEYFEVVSSHYNGEVAAQELRDDAQRNRDWLSSGLSAVSDRLRFGVADAVAELVRRCPDYTDLLLRDGPSVVLERDLHDIIGGGELGGLASLFASEAIESEQRRRNPGVDEWHRGFEQWFRRFVADARAGY